ncbi:hypothetical protein P886_3104 [Alteromonadaceae bacterium 2753L.S.0a.02]|nr:hypothetical protein P886_3104 [Alteromonadaceae bacterium 2753L.S.0a.02]
MIKLWAKFVVKYRLLVLISSLIIVVAAGMGLKNLYFESSTDIWFLENDPVLLDYNELKDKFGSDDYLVVGVESTLDSGDILNQETLLAIRKITDFLEEHVAVNKVRSINKFEYIFYDDDMLNVETAIPYSEDYDFSESELDSIRSILKKETIAHDLMFTKDLNNSIISARVVKQEVYTGPDNAKKDLAADFRTFIQKEGLDKSDAYKLHYSGSAIISESFFYYSTLDQSISYPLMMLFVLIFLFVLFRTWMGTVLPFGIMVISSVVSMGALGFTGWSVNMLNIIIPTILTVIALGSSIHVMMGFYRGKNEDLDSKEAAQKAIETYLRPCFFAFITTMFGFLALTTSKLALVVEFGFEMVIGVAAAFIFSLSTLPAILSYSSVDKRKTARLAETGWVARVIHNWPKKILAMRTPILITAAVITIPSLYLLSKVEVDTNFVRNFQKEAPVRQGLQYFDDTYKGALSLEFMLDSGVADGVKEPAFQKRALEFQEYVTGLEGTGRANSILNYLMKINQVMHDNDPDYFAIPETRNMVGQYLLLYSSSGPDEDLTDLMTFDGRSMRVSVFFEVAPSKVTKQRVEDLEKYIATHFSDLNIKVSGRAVLFNNMDTYVLEGLSSSFSLALVIITLCFFVLFRSIKYGLMSLIPNVLPIVIAGAIMGAMGIYLDFATLIIAATTLGIAVDDTIHFMTSYVSQRRNSQSHDTAVTHSIRQNGPAIISTTIVLVIGFSMLMLSSFVPNFYMGFIGVVVILFALVGDMVVLPAAIPSRGKFSTETQTKTLDVSGQEA